MKVMTIGGFVAGLKWAVVVTAVGYGLFILAWWVRNGNHQEINMRAATVCNSRVQISYSDAVQSCVAVTEIRPGEYQVTRLPAQACQAKFEEGR